MMFEIYAFGNYLDSMMTHKWHPLKQMLSSLFPYAPRINNYSALPSPESAIAEEPIVSENLALMLDLLPDSAEYGSANIHLKDSRAIWINACGEKNNQGHEIYKLLTGDGIMLAYQLEDNILKFDYAQNVKTGAHVMFEDSPSEIIN
jgi:hypothetical protein